MRTTNLLKRHAIYATLENGTALCCLALIMGLAFRNLGPEMLGLWSLIAAMTAFLEVGTLGLGIALSRHLPLALADRDQASVTTILATAITSLAVLAASLALLAYFPLSILVGQTIGDERLAIAHSVLVCSLIGFWLRTLASGFCHVLIGAHQTPMKCKLSIVVWGLRLLTTLGLLKLFGILALPLGLMAGNLVAILGGWCLIRRVLGPSAITLSAFNTQTFIDLLTYGIRLQGASLATLLFEPMTRVLVSWATNLETLAIYDLASRLVVSVRQLIVAAVQVAVPAIAKAGREDPKSLGLIYGQMIEGAWLGGTVVMACVCVSVPLIAYSWLGTMDPLFIGLAWCLIVGWWFTLFGLPDYMVAMGSGWTDIILTSQWSMALSGIILITAGRQLWEAHGVALGVAVALILSTCVLITLVRRRMVSIGRPYTMLQGGEVLLIIIALVVGGSLWFVEGQGDVGSALMLSSLSLPILSLTMASKRFRHLLQDAYPSRLRSK